MIHLSERKRKICYYETALSYRDPDWDLNNYIRWLRQELKSWRHMYWRLWGDCHFLYCGACRNYFPVYQMQWCCHHPEPPQFFTMEHQPTMTYPTGRFPCCGERAYRFEVLSNKSVSVIIILNQGCRHFTNNFESMKWLYVQFTDLTLFDNVSFPLCDANKSCLRDI